MRAQLKCLVVFICLPAMMALHACKKDEAPANPYDGLDHSGGNDSVYAPDSASIEGLQQYIFSPRCANPGCHDGTFEPDFRTVQSSYSTLVYRKANKRSVDGIAYFETRVIPGDAASSFLYERVTTPTSEYMPSNSQRLTTQQIRCIETWINNGAKDMDGHAAIRPDLPPNIVGFFALTPALQRLDTIRQGGNYLNPFLIPQASDVYLPIAAYDTADGSYATAVSAFTVHEIRCATSKDDFSNAVVIPCSWRSPLPVDYWQAVIHTSNFSVGQTYYFRVYMNDGHQAQPVEFPRNSSPDFYKSYYAFQVQ